MAQNDDLSGFENAAATVCPRCGGAGKVQNDKAVGARMRRRRIAAGLTLRGTARLTGVTAQYLCDLEHGRRIWTTKNVERYRLALRPAAAGFRRP